MTEHTDTARKGVVCHATGDRCHGCAHYRGEADICEFAPEHYSPLHTADWVDPDQAVADALVERGILTLEDGCYYMAAWRDAIGYEGKEGDVLSDPRVSMECLKWMTARPCSVVVREDEIDVAIIKRELGSWQYGECLCNISIDDGEPLERAICMAFIESTQ